MSLPKKGSRRITIDGQGYRWTAVYEPVDYCSATCPLRLIVQNQCGRGQIMVAQFQSLGKDEIGRVWMFPRYGSEITPGIVGDIIRSAQAAGWEPEKLGRPRFVIDGEPFLRLPTDTTRPSPNSEADFKRQFLAELREQIQKTFSDSDDRSDRGDRS